MMRILHIVSSMNRAGLENALMNYYRNVDRDKIQFDFLLSKSQKGDFEDEIESLGGRIYRIPMSNPLKYLWNLNRFFSQHKEYRICHLHHLPWGSLSLLFASLHGVQGRFSHVHFARYPMGKLSVKRLMRWMSRHYSTRYFACGRIAGLNFYGPSIVSSPEFRVLNNAIQSEKFSFDEEVRRSVRAGLGIADDVLVVGQVGRMTPVKNHKFTVDILCELKKLRGGKVKCVFVGEGPLMQDIEECAKEKGVAEECIFTGSTDNPQDYMQAMDYLIFPSVIEGLGLVAVEAQASGLRCVASSGVPSECKLTELVDFLPLSDGAQKWASHILDNSDYVRQSRQEEILRAGYDVRSQSKELQNFYLAFSSGID